MNRKVSRQRAWQIRMRQENRCIECGEPAKVSTRKGVTHSCFCDHHLSIRREYRKQQIEKQLGGQLK